MTWLSKNIFFVLWLAILLPLSVDRFWSIPAGRYHLRLNYFSFALFGLAVVVQYVRNGDRARAAIRLTLTQVKNTGYIQAFLVMAVLGCLGALLNSENRHRSLYFLFWSTGTLCLLPLGFRLLRDRVGDILVWSLLIYAGAQCAVVALDLLSCHLDYPWPALGQVFGAVFQGTRVCRPHAWYQEPNYLAGFLILVAVLARKTSWQIKRTLPERQRAFWAFMICLAGAVLTTSRLAWALVGCVGALELFFVFFRSSHLKRFLVPIASALVLILCVLLFQASTRQRISNFSPMHDASFEDRTMAGQAALFDFKQHPWVGVGPGGGGAYFVRHSPLDHPYRLFLTRIRLEWILGGLDNDPLAKDLFTELLSERGILGTVAFFCGLFFLLRGGWRNGLDPQAIKHYQFLLLTSIGLVYLTSQTLPRFDLWTVLSLLAIPEGESA